jgi:hypothetical protein
VQREEEDQDPEPEMAAAMRFGKKKLVISGNLEVRDPCPWCNGTGKLVEGQKKGQVRIGFGRSVHYAYNPKGARRCKACRGTGKRRK